MSPLFRVAAETGLTWRMSRSRIVGCMLRPWARKRKPCPSESTHWIAEVNNLDCAISSTTEIQDLPNRTSVRHEPKQVTRHLAGDLVQKGERESQWTVTVKRGETPHEQLSHRA